MVFQTLTNENVNIDKFKNVIAFNFIVILLALNFYSATAIGEYVSDDDSGVAVLLVDTDYVMGNVDEGCTSL